MKTKNLIITIITVLCLVLCVTILVLRANDVHFNFVTYHSVSDGEYKFSFKGSSDTVRKVKIEKNSKKLCTLPFNASPDIFTDDYSVMWEDVNFDGTDDLLLVFSIDEDNDKHYTAFLAQSDEFVVSDALTDLTNIVVDKEAKCLITSYYSKTYLEEPRPNVPEKYEERNAISKYELVNGVLINTEERAVTFYSENDIYCYSIYKYSEKYGKLTYFDEKWFYEKDLEKYTLSWD